jgi:hypothetical protein
MPSLPAVPVPPTLLTARHAQSEAFLILCVAIFAIAVGYAIARARRGDRVALLCLVGGLLAGVLEPMLDNLGLLWFAKDNVAIAVTTFHRYVPLYVVLGYGFFFGGQAYLAYRAIQRGKSARWFWGLYVFAWFFDFALQATGRSIGLYRYYGPQPFLLLGTPAWWFTIDAALPAIAGVAVFACRSLLADARSVVAIALVPAMYAGLNGAAGWPVFSGLNSHTSTVVVWLSGAATMALALLYQTLAVGAIGRLQVQQPDALVAV